MFPNSFSARVPERMALWGALIGFLLFLYGATEIIQASRMTEIGDDRRQATTALLSHVEAPSPGTAIDERQAERGKSIAKKIQSIDRRQASLRDNHRQNQLLIGLLAFFVVGMVLFLEYRWLVQPLVRIAAVLRGNEASWNQLTTYAPRRDEIGAFAQALIHHFKLVESQQHWASQQQQGLSERLARQETFRRESMSFQARIAEIVQRLEDHAGRMSTASGNLVTISTEADARAAASAESTQRVSGHVDVVAS